MKIPVFPLLAASFIALSSVAFSQDASNMFLQAYQEYQAAEKCERDGQMRDALNRYTTTVKTLEKIQKQDPDWQTLVVEYRLKKARESIERLRETITKIPSAPETVEAPLPTRTYDIDIPAPVVSTRQSSGGSPTPSPRSQSATQAPDSSDARRQLNEARRKISDLEDQLEKTKGDSSSVKMELEKTKTELVNAKSRLAQTENSLESVSRDRDKLKVKAGEPVDKRILDLSKRIAGLEADNEVLQDDNKRLLGKLQNADANLKTSKTLLDRANEERSAMALQRDQADARAKRLKDNSAEIERLRAERADFEKQLVAQKPKLDQLAKYEAENRELTEKLQNAEKILVEASKTDNQKALIDLNKEVLALQNRLKSQQSEIGNRDENIKSLMGQLEEATAESARLRLDPKQTEEQKRLFAENDLLRNIVIRQLKEQHERTVAAADLQNELENLQVKSEGITNQISILTNPHAPLSEQEKVLFRDPSISVQEAGPSKMAVSMVVVKQSPGSSPQPTPTPAPAPLEEEVNSLSPKARELATLAAKLYKDERYFDSVIIYRQALQVAPDNLFVIANLAVAKIQTGKLRDSQLGLEKVLEKKPRDLFALTNLSIVYSKQKNFDKAVATLNQILEIDPKNAVAHNYMAVALGKTGKNAEAEDYFKRSIQLDPNYATAYFNLAIMYINSNPPQVELARQNYEKAKSLGEDPNMVFEKKLAQLTSEAAPQATPQP